MNTAEIKNEFQKNAILASVLVGIIGTSLLLIVFKFGIVMTVIMYFVIVAITFIGIKPDEGE